MPRADVVVESPIVRSARVMQIESLFDVPASERARKSWSVDLPIEDRDWNIGLIVGPSGAGKTRVAQALFENLSESIDWSHDRAIVDEFSTTMSVHDVTNILSSVGLGSIPTWLRPFHTLSNGEQFRANMARLLAMNDDDHPVVVDEFTSVVDRQIAQVASNALQKYIRRESRKFVAVSCHFDIIDWLQPDWVYEPAIEQFEWRSVQPRPRIELEVRACSHQVWRIFRDHHYLSADLNKSARCFVGLVDDQPVAFTSYLHFPHPRVGNIKLGHRLVVLPDWQGLGIGGRIDDWLGQHLYEQGLRYRNVVAHPAMVNFYARSPRWFSTGKPKRQVVAGTSSNRALRERQLQARTVSTFSFEYRPPRQETTP